MKSFQRFSIVFFFIFITAFDVFCDYPVVNSTRPRIYADAGRLSLLRNLIQTDEDCKKTYSDIVYAYNNWWVNDPMVYTLGTDSSKWHWDWSSSWAANQVMLSTTIYKLTDDSLEMKRNRFVVRNVIQLLDTIDFTKIEWYEKENLLRRLSDACGFIFDWCYDSIEPELRTRFAKAIFKFNQEFMNSFIVSSAGNSYVSSHNTWNTIFCHQNALVLYDSPELNPDERDSVAYWFRICHDKIVNNFMPCWEYYRDDDGGWNWGAAYAIWSLTDQYQLFENLRIGTNTSWYGEHQWIENSLNQYIYFANPDFSTIHLGDGETEIKGDRVIYRHAAIYNDSRSKYLAHYFANPARTPNTMEKWNKLMFYEFYPDENYTFHSPLNWYADKVGLSVSRSSWENDATLVTFFNSPSKRAAHEHRDNNSFAVFKHKPLLIDAGYYDTYGGEHYNNYYTRTIAHNSVCVYDSTEKFFSFNKPVANDGGQIESPALMNYEEIFLQKNQRGKWIQYLASDDFSYSVADAQLSYNPKKLDYFRRRLLHVKPNNIFVLDNVHLLNTDSSQRDIFFTLHFANEPICFGNSTDSNSTGLINYFDTRNFFASNGSGNVSIRTLAPEQTKVRKVGGNGYEYFVDGKNYPPMKAYDTLRNTPGAWRLEVRPQYRTDSVTFVHSIEVGDSTALSSSRAEIHSSDSTIAITLDSTIFFFSPDGKRNSLRSVDSIFGTEPIRLFALDLDEGIYYVKVNNEVVNTIVVQSDGLLRDIVVPIALWNNIEITKFFASNHELSKANDDIIRYSNSTNILSLRNSENSMEIYDIKGRPVMIVSGSSEYSTDSLLRGVYIAVFQIGGKYYYYKLVKE